jgi:uncharacterized protein (DUF305 family)
MKCLSAVVGACLILVTPALADAPAPNPATAQYEVKFMTDMIDHHMMAIQTAQLCVARATHDELRQMCEDIIKAQMAEITTMQGWLQDWYRVSYSPEMKPGMMNQIEQLSRYYGAEFEIRFMQEMIRHHYKAVIEGARCMERAYHQSLLEMCENIVATQTAEIQQMRKWLCDWYGVCNWGPKGQGTA